MLVELLFELILNGAFRPSHTFKKVQNLRLFVLVHMIVKLVELGLVWILVVYFFYIDCWIWNCALADTILAQTICTSNGAFISEPCLICTSPRALALSCGLSHVYFINSFVLKAFSDMIAPLGL